MSIPYVLGKDCTITVGGIQNTAVRSAQWVRTAKEIEAQPYGQRNIYTFTAGSAFELEVEFIADPGLAGVLISGTKVAVSGSGGSGNFMVTNVARSEPLDDLVTWRVTLKESI